MKTTFALILGLALLSCSPSDSTLSTTVPSPVSTPIAAKPKPYPLETCIVSDNDLDSMGGEITKVYDGQQIKFCCKPCVRKFEANKPKYLAKLK